MYSLYPHHTPGVYEALNQSYSPSDLRKFQRIFNLPEQTIASDIGHHEYLQNCTFGLCGEANLDVQYIMAVAQDSPTTYYYTDESFGEWLVSMANMTNPPQVMHPQINHALPYRSLLHSVTPHHIL